MQSREDFIKELQDLLAAYQAADLEDRAAVRAILAKYMPDAKAVSDDKAD